MPDQVAENEQQFHQTIVEALGDEYPVDEMARRLKYAVQRLRAPLVGALQLTCSDESEKECVDALQEWLLRELLPSYKYWNKSPFRSANLGARYEWGAAPLAEAHFAKAQPGHDFKVMLIKLNAHVSLAEGPDGPVFGRMTRYDGDCVYCGALHALMDGRDLPAVNELGEAFQSEGLDRVALLNDPDKVDPQWRSLFAAIVSARLQARRVILDIQNATPSTPTYFLVVPCVTLNKPGLDGELVCGTYLADCRDPEAVSVTYQGLGDDPTRYEPVLEGGRLRVEDPDLHLPRLARDHRRIIESALKETKEVGANAEEKQVLNDALKTAQADSANKAVANAALKTLLWVAADLFPVPAALLLFAKGAIGIHHVYTVHKLAQQPDMDGEAKALMHNVIGQVDNLLPEQAQKMITALAEHYG